MEKKKRKVPVGLIALLVGLMVVGGWFYYQEVIVPSKYVVEDIDVPIETCVIWTNPNNAGHFETVKSMTDAMESSEAKFFIGEGDTNIADFQTISQTNKETFDTSLTRISSDALQIFNSNVLTFLNTDYSKISDEETFYWGKYLSGSNTLFGDQGIRCVNVGGNYGESYGIDEFFGTKIYDYFMEHQLIISCNDVQLTKICGGNVEEASISMNMNDSVVEQTLSYVFVGYADVTTENAVGSLSDMGIFGNVGETVKLKIIATGIDYGLHEIHLERVQ